MNKKSVFYTHSAAITALFVMGNAVINLPVKNADEYTFFSYLVTSLLSVATILILTPLANWVFGEEVGNTGRFKKIIIFIFCLLTAVFALFCAGDAFLNFGKFVGEILIASSEKAVIFLIFFAVSVFFVLRRQEDILKFALLGFWFCLLFVLFFFLGAAENYDMRNIFIFSLPDFKTAVSQAKPYFFNPFLPVLLIPVYQALVFRKIRKTALVLGAVSGYVMLGLCILGTLLLFGPELAGRLDYPYASAVSTVTVGRIFTRMDGFSYIIYFVSSLIKVTVCSFIIRSCLEKMNRIFN